MSQQGVFRDVACRPVQGSRRIHDPQHAAMAADQLV
jgi:hypothetical protein